MVLEIATVDIKEGTNLEFEANLKKAQGVVCKSPGYLSHEFQKCIERENRYVFLIKWTSLEAHNVGFRQSELFVEWRKLIGAFFDGTPIVEHFEYF